MVWGPGRGNAPPPGQDPFAAAERDTRAMVAAGWWQSAPPQQRQHAIAGRMLVLPDGTWWLFGAWARWYRLQPSDGQWYLCPPPHSPVVRAGARPAQYAGGQPPQLPPHVVPAGPDFSYDPSPSLTFVRRGFASELTARMRSTLASAAALPGAEYPHDGKIFTARTPSTVVAAWGVMLWCAAAPAFDARHDAAMTGLWARHRANPLPDVDGPRWLTPPPLSQLVGLYAERLRAGRVDSAVVVLRTIWATASALRDDPRFQARSDALLAMAGATLGNPTVDYGALPYGDEAIVQQWLTRCPPHLVPALRTESSPGDSFRHAFYTFAEAVADITGDASDPAYIEPRMVAAALLAADLAVVREDVASAIVPWLDPEIRYTVQAVMSNHGHPLRRLWPDDLTLAEPLRSAVAASGEGADTLLAAMYELDLAWCRLAGGMPARPRGFPTPNAIVAGIIGPERTRATSRTSTGIAIPKKNAHSQPPSPFGMPVQPAQPGQAPQPPQAPYAPPGAPDMAGAPGGPPGAGAPPQPLGQPPVPGAFGPPATPGYPPQGAAQGAFGQPGVPGRPAQAVQPPGQPYVQPPANQEQPFVQPAQPVDPQFGAPAQPVDPQFGASAQSVDPQFGVPAQPVDPQFGAPAQPVPHVPKPATGQDEPQESFAPPYTALGYQPSAGNAVPSQNQPPGGFVPPGAGPGGGAPAGFNQYGAPAQPPHEVEEATKPDGSSSKGGLNEPQHPPYAALGYAPSGSGPGQPPVPSYEQGMPQPPNRPGGAAGYPGSNAPGNGQPGQIDPHGTRFDEPAALHQQAPPPVIPPKPDMPPPRTRVLGPDDSGAAVPGAGAPGAGAPGAGGPGAGGPGAGGPPKKPDPPGTRVMSETMIGGFDFLDQTPSPERPVHEIPPPSDRTERRVLERYGIGFVSGAQDVAELLDGIREQAEAFNAVLSADDDSTRIDEVSGIRRGVPSVLLVGAPHTGQRRLARMVALTLAEAGLGDGTVRAHDADDVRESGARTPSGAPPKTIVDGVAPPTAADLMKQVLGQRGPAILFERLDAALFGASDPAAFVTAVRRARRDPSTDTALIATCEPSAYKRMLTDHPRLVEAFRVYRLPDLSDPGNRMTLLHLLADERRVTVGGVALGTAGEDLGRLRGPGDLVNARLVEAYLDTACQRHLERAGASRDRLVLDPQDLHGIAEGLEPALRPPGDIDGYLRQLDALRGLDEVKYTVHELVEEARVAADRARYGVTEHRPLHLLLSGPHGTGKSTVAALVGGMFAALGLLGSGHVVACRPPHLTGRDGHDTEARVRGMVDQALGGVLLVQEAHLLDRVPEVVDELRTVLRRDGHRLLVVCAGPPDELHAFLAANPALREEFGQLIEFEPLGDRELVGLFQSYAERDLYMLDEELRVELLGRFEQMRGDPSFGYARTVRELFEGTIARQAARLAGADVDASTVARLTVGDLPESSLQQMMGGLQEGY
ncbi:hypothetical protein AB0L06_12805 [Spirillospora sp. NPDC052269]